MADKPTDTGMNRTGIATSPIDSKRTIEGAEQAQTAGPLDGRALESERLVWAKDADPIGSVPPPGTLKGFAKTVMEKLQGHQPTVLIDKLGGRLAYERAGTRLYDALLVKHAAANVHEGGPTREELLAIRMQEHQHMMLVASVIERLGADPTAMTPCADISGVAGLGWVQVLTDPRTTLSQCLDIMLIVEQGDVDGWGVLIELVDQLGMDDVAEQFREASAVEQLHAAKLRSWVTKSVLGQAGVMPTPARDLNNPART
ncbi:MAG TPA: ferritin-like domain-containing protein [Kofleriaceae bacterium]|nr:ferritin-like domain-containing protein [Kofleriaceae bacterium]